MIGHFYIKDNIVFMPVMGKVSRGYYVDIDPVVKVLMSDAAGWSSAIAKLIYLGNPKIPFPKSEPMHAVVLKNTRYKRWQDFQKGMMCWEFETTPEGGTLMPLRMRSDRRGHEPDTENQVALSAPSPNELADAIVQRVLSG